MADKMADNSVLYDPDSPLCNATALRRATRRISQIYDERLQPCGLKTTQRSLLRYIDQLRGPTMGQLAGQLLLDKTALSHNLKPMIRDGYVEVTAAETDRRTKRLTLTAKGQQALAASHRLWVEIQRDFARGLTAEQHQTLLALLDIISSDDFARQMSSSAQ
ncbi:winged helix-turn-helix transcriptional regulator [Shimwellia pseudoproteus]|uniref:MarR family winged helix-turn-helix transcriptional regulator n=1 Tax=Shimwellia pseudoproteus TaxID=570012 RepID=UPI0018EDC5EF|nr:MarR family winged helix-turn-helix transcriptional regulator [Shimwellia pseudoproteus]MBJ3816148.1 winged helix-turn-helix transcriptional regulator [Shimwellia pseudoproteus]